MKVCVVGLWHQGSVVAACLAAAGHDTVGLDFEPERAERLQAGEPPLLEPDLAALIKGGLAEGRLRFTTDVRAALSGAELVWVAYDTPVDADDRAQVGYVVRRVCRLFPHLEEGSLVLVSSQLPVGTTHKLELRYAGVFPQRQVAFAYMAENLRLGQAVQSFTKPDRVVIGVRGEADKAPLAALFAPLGVRIEWMSVESAEMAKHAVNAFLATSVTFINEIASLCELVGADARDVERALRSEQRIGPRAYLRPGGAFAGGTLARDLGFLRGVGRVGRQPTPLLAGVQRSNAAHKHWPLRRLAALMGSLTDRTIAIWGLAYKPGTDSLRRSAAVELCGELADGGAKVQIHDPVVTALPGVLARRAMLCPTPLAAVMGASALVVATPWPEYAEIAADSILTALRSPLVLDANGLLAQTFGNDPRVRYVTVGSATA